MGDSDRAADFRLGAGDGGVATRFTPWLLSAGGRVRQGIGPHGERVRLTHDVRGRVTQRVIERDGFRPERQRLHWDGKDRLLKVVTFSLD